MPDVSIQDAANRMAECLRSGRMAEAEAICSQLLAQFPQHEGIVHFAGILAYHRKEYGRSLEFISRVAESRPNHAPYQAELGELHRLLRNLEPAEIHLRKVVVLTPEDPAAQNNLALVLEARGKFEEAANHYRRAIELNPNDAIALTNYGTLLSKHLGAGNGETMLRRAIALNPNLAAAYMGLGNALYAAAQPDEAAEVFRRGIQLDSSSAAARCHLAYALWDQGKQDEAIESYRKAREVDPQYQLAESALLYAMTFHPGFDAAAIHAEQRGWNQRHARPLAALRKPFSHDRSENRRLRIGYVSPYFYSQAEAFFIVPLLSGHNHDQFEIFCYSNSTKHDDTTDRMRSYADGWRDIAMLSEDESAEVIRNDRIDILVDLAMHMATNQIYVFARKPAPVQATWLAYPGGTGLEGMDYRITDWHMDPPGTDESVYTEKSIRLEGCWCCYDPLCDVPVLESRAEGPICFGSINTPRKLNEPLLSLWAKVLKAAEGSRLILQVNSEVYREQIRGIFRRGGIELERIEFVGFLPREKYLRIYDRIDIGLDPLPYNGITTTCDAMWMGAPVVTLKGQTAAGKAGAGIMTAVGLSDLVADTPEKFVEIAVGLARDRARLAELHGTLRQRMARSPLMDAKGFARQMEEAYRRMWREYVRK